MNQNNYNLIGLGVLLLLGSFGGGYYMGTGNKEIQIQEKIIYKEQEVKIEYRDRTVIKERTITPDGTITEREIDRDVSKDTETHTSEKETDKSETTKSLLTNYSLGLRISIDYNEIITPKSEALDVNNYDVILGRRLIGPSWIELGGNLKHITLGVRYEF